MENIEYIIFDFDHTISANHLHNESGKILFSHPQFHDVYLKTDEIQTWDLNIIDYIWDALQNNHKLITTGDVKEWQTIFTRLIDANFKVYIASFSSFALIIRRFLKETIQLPDHYLQKITVEAWLPYNQQNKNLHLDRILTGQSYPTPVNWEKQILSDEKRQSLYKKLILIDDSLNNTESVLNLVGDQHIIHVPQNTSIVPKIIMDTLGKRLDIKF